MENAVKNVMENKVSRQQLRQKARDDARMARLQQFVANEKIGRAEFHRLTDEVVRLKQSVAEYMTFARNIFFALDAKGLITLGEMDEISTKRNKESEIYREIDGNTELPLSDKVALARERGLSPVFIDLLSSAEKAQNVQADNK